MFKKLLLAGLLMVWFCITFVSMASEASSNTYKWFKFEVTIPTDFVFDKNIVIELINQDTNEKLITYAKKEDNYMPYLNVTEGRYIINSVSVPGNYEGYFSFGYPEKVFTITKTSEDVTIVPILVELHYYGDENISANDNNLYEGMTYEEVMSAVEAEKSNSEGTVDAAIEDIIISESTKEETSYYETEEEPVKSLDDKILELKDDYEDEKQLEEAKKASNDSLKGGLFVMCIVLIASGLGFYLFKKKRDL